MRPRARTSGDEQTANARLVEAIGGAVVFPQVTLTSDRLLEAATRLLADRAELKSMGERARGLAVPDAFGLGDRGQQLLVELHHEAAGPGALARAEDEAIKIGREPDEVEFLHARP